MPNQPDAIVDQKYDIKPAAGRIAVRVENVEGLTKSGLVLLSDPNGSPTVGTVHAIAEDQAVVMSEDDNTEVEWESRYKVGDVVIFGKFTGSRVQVDRKTFIILREGDVLATLVPSATGVPADQISLRERTDSEPEA